MSQKPWCVEPFITLENKVSGPWGLCCKSKSLSYTDELSPLEHFNSETMKRIRKDMLNHNVTEEIQKLCQSCILHENDGITSRRQRKAHLDIPEVSDEGDVAEYQFNTIEVKFFGNLCNLKCKMCKGELSSSIAADEKKAGRWTGPTVIDAFKYVDQDKFYSDMREILPNARMIKFTGGEPTMNVGITQFIEWIVDNGYARKLELKIITNGTRRSDRIIELSRHFKRFVVDISVDATWEIDEYQRVGTKFEDVIENIHLYKNCASIKIGPVITALNVGDVSNLVAFAKAVDAPLDLSSIANDPPHMKVDVLPIAYRQHLLNEYDYPKEIKTALESDHWNKEGYDKLLSLNPDIFDYIPTLKDFT